MKFKIDWDCDDRDAISPCCVGHHRHNPETMLVYYTPFHGRTYSRMCADQIKNWKAYGWAGEPILVCQQCWEQHE